MMLSYMTLFSFFFAHIQEEETFLSKYCLTIRTILIRHTMHTSARVASICLENPHSSKIDTDEEIVKHLEKTTFSTFFCERLDEKTVPNLTSFRCIWS